MESCKVIRHIASAMENGEYDFDGTPEKHVSLPFHVIALNICFYS